MNYVIKIGERDNCYIITKGITGLDTFYLTEINGTSDPVVISIDSEKDDITSSWIKQSLRVNMIKTSSSQFSDIINGNDNETYGVLIEGGHLYLEGGELMMSSGSKLKFIGTLTLESYVEDYKAESIVSFTFFDKIGMLSDDVFHSDKRYKTFPDIIANLVSDVSCSDRIKIEWPYSINGSNLPHSLLVLIDSHDGDQKIDLLQKLLSDFFLQIYVDFEDVRSGYLKDCGCIKIRSITNVTSGVVRYYYYTKSSYTASVCQRIYYQYSYVNNELLSKSYNELNTDNIPIINADAKIYLDRIASSVVATNEIVEKNMVFRGDADKTFTYKIIGSRGGSYIYYYCPFGLYEASSDVGTPVDDIKSLLNEDNINDLDNPAYGVEGITIGSSYLTIEATSVWRLVLCRQVIISPDDFIDNSYKIKFKVSALNPTNYTIFISFSAILRVGTSYYVNDGNSWVEFTSMNQLKLLNKYEVQSGTTKEYEAKLTISNPNNDTVTLIAAVQYSNLDSSNIPGPYGAIAIKSVQFYSILDETLPDKQVLTTILSGNNRKIINISPTFLNKPNVENCSGIVDNLLATLSYSHPLTITYDNSDQSLLAHISDQYGWQYENNKWNLEASIKGESLPFNLNERYYLDDMYMIVVSGDYSAKRRELSGKWCQVLKPNPIYLLQDNFIPFKWDNGNLIKLG